MIVGVIQQQNATVLDVTPDPVDWANVSYSEVNDGGTIAVQQITGIDTPITLNISWTAGDVRIYYRIDNTSPTWSNGSFFSHGGWHLSYFNSSTELIDPNGSTFSVSNNQYVSFFCLYGGPVYNTGLVAVENQSDNNVVLDTFNWETSFF